MRRITRAIRVGATVVEARVCTTCPTLPAIWPAALYKRHVAAHEGPQLPLESYAWINQQRRRAGLARLRRKGGRPLGAKNRVYRLENADT